MKPLGINDVESYEHLKDPNGSVNISVSDTGEKDYGAYLNKLGIQGANAEAAEWREQGNRPHGYGLK